ncbi:MAG TPA: chloride channel protein [Coriobacteriia bacterium]|nr:chloride channel protein [Coriobacteriia bacterium]
MPDSSVDSVTAARAALRLSLIAIAIGALCGLTTWAFLALDHLGMTLLWHDLPDMAPQLPAWVPAVAVVVLMSLLATVIVAIVGRRPFDLGEAEAEYDHEGRIGYRHLLSGAAFALTSLWSGAVVGPEAALTDINGGIGTFVADRLRVDPKQVQTMAYAGVAGAFAAFFGSAPVGALLAAELISPKSLNISRTKIVAGLGAGATGWAVYSLLGGPKLSAILTFAATPTVRLTDLALALGLGAAGSMIGLLFGSGLLKTRLATQRLRTRPWLAGLAGGAVTAAAAVVSPFLLFSGQEQTPEMIAEAASIGALMLVVLGVAKLALCSWHLSTAYFGGPIFPAIFAGTAFGLALNLVIPGIPQGVAVMGIVTGLVVAASVAPLSVTIFLSLIAAPELAPVIAIAAVSAFLVRQLVAPTLPGIYRATRAEEARKVAEATA